MKVKKMLRPKRSSGKTGEKSLNSIVVFSLFAVLCFALLTVPKIKEKIEESEVYAAAEPGGSYSVSAAAGGRYQLPPGLAGVAFGLENSMPGVTVNRIGASCEQLMVGQRARITASGIREWNVGASLESKVDELNSAVYSLSASPKMMSDKDYENLLKIVEAEAGIEDLKGKILVANVVMNRVKHEEFPDTVTDVVWERCNGVAQFSPTYDGRINQVVVSDETREAVKQALEGVDYSEGALYFIQKSAADKEGISWFDSELKWLFKHGCHEFYTYPEEEQKTEDSVSAEEDQLVQMVKS